MGNTVMSVNVRDEIIDEIISGNPDRVNPAIEKARDRDHGERARLFEECFDKLKELYRGEEDGYKRQSIVRFLRAIYHPLIEGGLEEDCDEKLREFYLDCLEDDDGRVRLAAVKGLKRLLGDKVISGDKSHLLPCLSRLEEMKEKFQGKKKKHVEKAIEHVDWFSLPQKWRMMETFHRIIEKKRGKKEE